MALDYATARKKTTTSQKVRENYLVIKFGYDHKMVLPHAAGLALMQALNQAESLLSGYSAPTRISPMDRDIFSASQMSWEEYEQIKIAALLNCTLDEVKEYALAAEAA